MMDHTFVSTSVAISTDKCKNELMPVFDFRSHVFKKMKHLRDTADDDDKRRLSRIVTEVCASITSRLNVFLAETSDSGGRAAWKIPRIQNVLEHEFLHFPDRKWLESYRISKDMFEQLTHDLRSLQRQVTRLRRGSGWGLVSSVIWPFFLILSVKMGKILMLSV